MKPEINLLDYRSYRKPFLFEFIPGFQYKYAPFTIKYPYPFKVGQRVNWKKNIAVGEIVNLYTCDGIEYADILTSSHTKVLHKRNCIPTSNLKPFWITQHHWRKGIWGSAWGLQNIKHIEELLKKDQIIRKWPVPEIDLQEEQIFKKVKELNEKDTQWIYNQRLVTRESKTQWVIQCLRRDFNPKVIYKKLGGNADEETKQKWIHYPKRSKRCIKIQKIQITTKGKEKIKNIKKRKFSSIYR